MPECRCPRCQSRVMPRGPSLGARVACVAGVLSLAASCLCAPALGFVLPAVAPVLVVAGMGLGPLVDAATRPTTCPECFVRLEPAEVRAPLAVPRLAIDTRAP